MYRNMLLLVVLLFSFGTIGLQEQDDTSGPDSEFSHEVVGSFQFSGNIFEYGYFQSWTLRSKGGYYLIRNQETMEIVTYATYNENDIESFTYLGIVGSDRLLAVCEVWTLSHINPELQFKESVVLLFDFSGNLIANREYPQRFVAFHNHGFEMIVASESGAMHYFDQTLEIEALAKAPETAVGVFDYQFQGKALVNGNESTRIHLEYPGYYDVEIIDGDYCFSFSIVLHPEIIGIETGGIYDSAIAIRSEGTLLVNGSAYISGTIIDSPGNYLFTVLGANDYRIDIPFTIIALVYNVHDGMWADEPIRILTNGKRMELDNEPYNGELIEDAGQHVFRVYGEGDYVEEIGFGILPGYSGVSLNGIYDGAVEIRVNCYARLNNEEVDRHFVVDQPGEYVLVLYLDGNPHVTIGFKINAINESGQDKCGAYLIYLFGLVSLVGLVLLFKKK